MPASLQSPENKNSVNLDVLRSISVLMVIWWHLAYFLGYSTWHGINIRSIGWLGVYFFFVHTTYVLMFSLNRINTQNNLFSTLCSFYCKRFFRIYPLSIFIVLLVAFFTLPGHISRPWDVVESVESIRQIIANIFLIQNITHHTDIIGPLWTLPIEVQMYIFLPFLYFLWKKPFGIIIIIGLWGWILLLKNYIWSLWSHLKVIQYFPIFSAGILGFLIYRKIIPKIRGIWFLCFILLLILIFFTGKIFIKWEVGIFVYLLLGCGLPFFQEIDWKYIRIVSHIFAKYSYTLYLIHNTCIWAAFEIGKVLPFYTQIFFFVLLLVVIPFWLYKIIEAPWIYYWKQIEQKIQQLFEKNKIFIH